MHGLTWKLRLLASTFVLVTACGIGCQRSAEIGTDSDAGNKTDSTAAASAPMKMSPDPAKIKFKDTVKSNTEVPLDLDGLVFFDTAGRRVGLEDYLGKKNIVLVFTEGFAGMLCPFCKTQTSRLVANYEKFQQANAEVLVVYPGTRDHLDEFIEAAKTTDKRQVSSVPFPIVLDEEFGATDFFQIRSNHAHPSTFIIDTQGNVVLAYVGADMTADRPSVAAMLRILDDANDNL